MEANETILEQVETISENDVEKNNPVLDLMQIDTERAIEARGRNIEDVPRSYWWSPGFLGSYCALALACNAGLGGFSLVAPILGDINNDLGASPNIAWVPTAWLLCQGIGSLIVGRFSDIFGRRWLFISGSVIGLIGTIFASQVRTVNQLIGAETIMGIGAGIQINHWWAASEIVPMKYRYLAIGGIFILSPYNHLGPKIAYSILTQTSTGWRGVYYLLIATNALSVLVWYLFYHPPTFKMLHRRKAVMDIMKTFDWIGVLLYTASTVVFLLGFQWGGALYSWKSAHVIATILAGAAGLVIFIAWEYTLPKRSPTTIPFAPLQYLKNFKFMVITIMTGVGGAAYYGFTIIWPAAVQVIYTGSGYSASHIGTLLGVVSMSYVYGQATMTILATWTGPKPPLVACMMISGPIIAAAAYDPLNFPLTVGLIIVGSAFIGGMEGIALVTTTFPLRTQEEIGTAGGLSGIIRVFFAVVSITIYETTLSNRILTTVPANVIPAATDAGLPASSIPALIKGLSGATALNSELVPGLTAHIIDVAQVAYRLANSQAYRTVFLVSLAFTGPGMILCWFCSQNDKSKEAFIAGHIHKSSEEKELEAE